MEKVVSLWIHVSLPSLASRKDFLQGTQAILKDLFQLRYHLIFISPVQNTTLVSFINCLLHYSKRGRLLKLNRCPNSKIRMYLQIPECVSGIVDPNFDLKEPAKKSEIVFCDKMLPVSVG